MVNFNLLLVIIISLFLLAHPLSVEEVIGSFLAASERKYLLLLSQMCDIDSMSRENALAQKQAQLINMHS